MALMNYSQAAATALAEAMRADPNVVALGEDLGRGGIFAQYRGLQQEFGAERVIDTPISEATIMGAAVGMALAGLRPVVEMRVVDFALCAMDELVNQAAKNRYMFGGQGRVPLVVADADRLVDRVGGAAFAVAGSVVRAHPGPHRRRAVAPADNYGLLHAARSNRGDPVVYLEHKELWGLEGEVEPGTPRAARRGARRARGRRRHDRELVEGDADLRRRGGGARRAPASRPRSSTCARSGRGTARRSARPRARTGALLVVHEAVQVGGFGAEIAAAVAEETGCRVKRLGAPRIPSGYSKPLEDESRVTVAQVVAAASSVVSR